MFFFTIGPPYLLTVPPSRSTTLCATMYISATHIPPPQFAYMTSSTARTSVAVPSSQDRTLAIIV
ncbi:unnamed protein product [Prunus armeniaca]|uniref:Uncharacterized protein n=1 Tax=Prunus armeniaca TaxID=36596 RepID=A0A6J5TWH8_PRUAR|nr:unnamed protein product [Prunus armeniaca]